MRRAQCNESGNGALKAAVAKTTRPGCDNRQIYYKADADVPHHFCIAAIGMRCSSPVQPVHYYLACRKKLEQFVCDMAHVMLDQGSIPD